VTTSYKAEDLEHLSESEQKFVESIEDDAHRNAVACSLIQHRVPDKLAAGDLLPDLSLQKLDGSGAQGLRAFVGDRPVLLVFGSYT
jgi:hypothetical protein